MALRLALVIDGNQDGAKKVLEDTAGGIEKVKDAATRASEPLGSMSEGIGQISRNAEDAGSKVGGIGESASVSGGKFDSLKTLALGAIGGIAGGFVTAGLTVVMGAIGEAAVAMASSIVSSGQDIEAALRNQADLIRDVKAAYAEANGAASSYGNNSRQYLAFQAQQTLGKLRDADQRTQSEVLSGDLFDQLGFMVNPFSRGSGIGIDQGSAIYGTAFEAPVRAFREELRDGTADAIKFKNEIAAIGAALPASDETGRAIAEKLLADVDALAKVQEELKRTSDVYEGLKGDAEASVTALGGTVDKYKAIGDQLAIVLPMAREFTNLNLGGGVGVISVPGPGAGGTGGGGGFAAGGYTGDMDAGAVAGVVHGREFVVNAVATERNRPLLEAINRGMPGFASGGFGGGTPYSTAGGGFGQVNELLGSLGTLKGAITEAANMFLQLKSPLEVFGGVLSSVSQRFLGKALGAVEDAIFGGSSGGGLLGGLFGGVSAGVMHTGGEVGGAAIMRQVPTAAFLNAPRFHNGLFAEDEFPAVLQRGERVIPRGASLGGQTINNFYVSTPSPRSFAQSPSTAARGAARLARSTGRHS